MGLPKAYAEVVDFLAAGTTPKNLVAFRPSESARDRVRDLVRREKSVGLDSDEQSELDQYLHLEHLMRLAKARAKRYVDSGAS